VTRTSAVTEVPDTRNLLERIEVLPSQIPSSNELLYDQYKRKADGNGTSSDDHLVIIL